MNLLTFERVVWVRVVEDAFVKIWSKFLLLFYWWLAVKESWEVTQGCLLQKPIPCSLIDAIILAIKQSIMFANGLSWGYSVYENEKSVLKFKILIIKIFLFFCHELLICLISENLNFTVTEQLLEGWLAKFYHQ